MTDVSTHDPLTERQQEIAQLIADDLTNGEISERLGISLATTKHHVSEILARLDLRRREEVGDWYQARYRPGVLRRLRGALPVPTFLLVGGAAAVAVLVVVAALLANQTGSTSVALVLAETPAPGHLVAYTIRPFISGSSPPTELWVRDLETGENRLLVSADDGFGTIFRPRWTPDGEAVSFVSAMADDPLQIHTVTLNGDLDIIEIDGKSSNPLYSWAPTGDRLAVTTSPLAGRGPTTLSIVDDEGHDLGQPELDGLLHAWSPDGQTIYYQRASFRSDPFPNFAAYAFSDGVEEPVPIVGPDYAEHTLVGVTSTTGSLVFELELSEQNQVEFVRVVSDDGESQWLTAGAYASASPFGDLIAVGEWRGLHLIGDDGEIFSVERLVELPILQDGGRLVDRPPYGGGGITAAVFTADGILVRKFELPEGERFNSALELLGGFGVPIWSPDGSQVLLPTETRGEVRVTSVWLADIATGKLTLLNRSEPATDNELYGSGTRLALAFGP